MEVGIKNEINADNKHNYVKIYPSYLDKNVKVAEGRRVNLENAVPDITTDEIFAAIKFLNFKSFPEYVSFNNFNFFHKT